MVAVLVTSPRSIVAPTLRTVRALPADTCARVATEGALSSPTSRIVTSISLGVPLALALTLVNAYPPARSPEPRTLALKRGASSGPSVLAVRRALASCTPL